MNDLELREYADADGYKPFAEWWEGLRDSVGKARIYKRLAKLRAGLLGDWKAVGGGIVELREDHGPGYRIYIGRHGDKLIVLLAGGEKRSQQKDIENAKRYWSDWQAR